MNNLYFCGQNIAVNIITHKNEKNVDFRDGFADDSKPSIDGKG